MKVKLEALLNYVLKKILLASDVVFLLLVFLRRDRVGKMLAVLLGLQASIG